MADPPDRQPGQRSLFELGVQRVEKRPPPEVTRAEVEREMEAKRQGVCGGGAGNAGVRFGPCSLRD